MIKGAVQPTAYFDKEWWCLTHSLFVFYADDETQTKGKKQFERWLKRTDYRRLPLNGDQLHQLKQCSFLKKQCPAAFLVQRDKLDHIANDYNRGRCKIKAQVPLQVEWKELELFPRRSSAPAVLTTLPPLLLPIPFVPPPPPVKPVVVSPAFVVANQVSWLVLQNCPAGETVTYTFNDGQNHSCSPLVQTNLANVKGAIAIQLPALSEVCSQLFLHLDKSQTSIAIKLVVLFYFFPQFTLWSFQSPFWQSTLQ